MQTPTRHQLLAGIAVAAVLAITLVVTLATGSLGARAAGSDSTVYFGGMDISKRTIPVLTVFNAQEAPMPLDIDVVLRDGEGQVLISRDNVLSLGDFESGSVDLFQELIRDLPRRTKPYQGIFSLEVTSDSPAFEEAGVIAHVTEFFGKPTRARAALLFDPTWHVTPDDD